MQNNPNSTLGQMPGFQNAAQQQAHLQHQQQQTPMGRFGAPRPLGSMSEVCTTLTASCINNHPMQLIPHKRYNGLRDGL